MRDKYHEGLTFQTRQLSVITILYHMFYINGIKTIPSNIKDYLDAQALAYWIMGDGTARNKGLALCTDSFKQEHLNLLIYALAHNFGLQCTTFTHSPGHVRLHIEASQMNLLRSIVVPYMHGDMLYKLGLPNVS